MSPGPPTMASPPLPRGRREARAFRTASRAASGPSPRPVALPEETAHASTWAGGIYPGGRGAHLLFARLDAPTATSFRANSPQAIVSMLSRKAFRSARTTPASSIMTWLTSPADPKLARGLGQIIASWWSTEDSDHDHTNANGQLHVVTHVGEPPAASPEVQLGPSGRQRTVPPGMTR